MDVEREDSRSVSHEKRKIGKVSIFEQSIIFISIFKSATLPGERKREREIRLHSLHFGPLLGGEWQLY